MLGVKDHDICQVNVFALYLLGTAPKKRTQRHCPVLAYVAWNDFGVRSSDSEEIETRL